MSDIAILLWGMAFGWFAATWRERKPTNEHVLGSKIIAGARSTLSQAKFIGAGFRSVHSAKLKVDGNELDLKITAEGK